MKRAFTLIEVMVVIVILGILAAVGVPKLFGTIAKAKASEVPVAAGTYTKLQDAFLTEKTAVGNWKNIGYVAPGNGATTNFCYSQGSLTQDTISMENISEGVIGWGARAIVSLNDCGVGSWWSLVITPDGSNSVNYAHNLSYAPCMALTTNWNEGNTLVGDCENSSSILQNNEKKDDVTTPSSASKNEHSEKQVERTEEDATDATCSSGKKIQDPRCCNGNNKDSCNCGVGQAKKLGLSC